MNDPGHAGGLASVVQGPDDAALLRRIGAGDQAAMAEFYRRHGQLVLAQILLVAGGERALAEEILQDTMLAVWRGAGSFRGESSIRSWVIAIARRQARDRRRGPRMRVVDDAGLDARPGGEPGPELVALGRAEVAEVGSGGTLAAQEVSIGAELRTPASGPGHPGSPRPGHPGSRDRTPADLGIAAGTVTGSNDGGFTLVTASGLDIQVTTSASTTVYTMEDTSLSGLRTGAFTAAAGQAGPDGTLAATAVHQGAHLPVGGPGRPGTSLPRLPAGVGCSSAAVTTALLTAG